MNEITSITPQTKDKTRCNIYIDGRFYCGLTLQTAITHRLKVGQTVDLDFLSQIQLDSEKQTALDKALTHISATRKTEKQVRDFLSAKGYLPSVVDYVLEKMRGYNFLNDSEYAETFVQSFGEKKGERLIRMQLQAKGVDKERIEQALDNLDEEKQQSGAVDILQKYMRGKVVDKPTLAKAFRYLMSKGYTYEVAKYALSTIADLDEE